MSKVKKRSVARSQAEPPIIDLCSPPTKEEKTLKQAPLFGQRPPKEVQPNPAKRRKTIKSEQPKTPRTRAAGKENAEIAVEVPVKYANFDHAPLATASCCFDETTISVSKDWTVPLLAKKTNWVAKSKWRWSELNYNEDVVEEPSVSFENAGERSRKLEEQLWSEKFVEDNFFCPDGAGRIEVKRVLGLWHKRLSKEEKSSTKTTTKKKRRKVKDLSESEEEYDSDGDDYNPEDDGEGTRIENPIFIWGAGQYKETMVYSLAQELDFKVLEIHPGDKRDGESLKKRIQAAATSHRLDVQGLSNFFSNPGKQPAKKKHTIILISNADIIFSMDRDFATAVQTVLQDIRVPVVITGDVEPDFSFDDHVKALRVEVGNIANIDRKLIQKLAARYGGMSIRKEDARRLLPTLHESAEKLVNWLQFACGAEGPMPLPKLQIENTASDDATIGWELEPTLPLNYDFHEWAQEKRRRYAEMRPRHYGELRSGPVTVQPPRRSMSNLEERQVLVGIQLALQYLGGTKDLSTDLIPWLCTIDKEWGERMAGNRRAQHYFNRVDERTGKSIDCNGQLALLLGAFRFLNL
ncbi:unnamed protein product, partial [Mesorhabditis spiculigera]